MNTISMKTNYCLIRLKISRLRQILVIKEKYFIFYIYFINLTNFYLENRKKKEKFFSKVLLNK